MFLSGNPRAVSVCLPFPAPRGPWLVAPFFHLQSQPWWVTIVHHISLTYSFASLFHFWVMRFDWAHQHDPGWSSHQGPSPYSRLQSPSVTEGNISQVLGVGARTSLVGSRRGMGLVCFPSVQSPSILNSVWEAHCLPSTAPQIKNVVWPRLHSISDNRATTGNQQAKWGPLSCRLTYML